VPDHDATVVARLEAAGAILLGKLNTTEGAMAGYHPDFRVPRNPWGEDLWPGVSSSGSGVATAAGLCFASLGTDTGGSIRYPAAMNGIVGLKPTWGRVSRFGVLDLAPSLDHVGPMTRRVADAAAVLQAIAGADPNDPTALPDEVPDYLGSIAEGIEGVRLGFDEHYATRELPEHYAESIRNAVSTLEGLGARVVAARMPTMDAPHLEAWQTICAAEAAAVHEATFPSKADSYGPWFRSWLQLGANVTGIQYAKAHALRKQLAGAVRTAFVGIDLLACPSVLSEPFPYDRDGVFRPPDLEAGTSAGVPLSWFNGSRPFILPYDYNGYPSLSLPCGASPEGLPLSLQLVGHPLGEALLCRVGYAFEQATEWHRRHPPI
jgi:amidase